MALRVGFVLRFFICALLACTSFVALAETRFTPRDSFAHATLNGTHYVFGGYGPNKKRLNDVYALQQGQWSKVGKGPFEPRNLARAVEHQGGIYLIGGHTKLSDGTFQSYDDVWRFDGSQWIQLLAHAQFGSRAGFGLASYQGDLYVMGGMNSTGCANSDTIPHYGDVWKSPDGLTWEHLPVSFSPRSMMDAMVFKDHLLLVGGGVYQTNKPMGGVIEPLTGKIYKTNLPPRYFARATVFKNQMAVLGGWSDRNLNDVWTSNNGKQWKRQATPLWSKRHEMGVFTEKDTLIVTGGLSDEKPALKNDLWVTHDLNTWGKIKSRP